MTIHDTPMPELPALAAAGGVFFVTLTRDRLCIASTIERLIDMLDAMEPDPDLEPYLADTGGDDREYACEDEGADSGDFEPTMGSSNDLHGSTDQTRWAWGCQWDECEEENEHGGDILDEPHDGDELELDEAELDCPGFIWGGNEAAEARP